MSVPGSTPSGSTPSSPDNGDTSRPLGLLRELSLLRRYRVPFLLNVAIITLAAVVYSVMTEEQFEAHTSLLPSEESGSLFGGLAGLIGNLPIQGANLPGVTTSTDLLATIAGSRRLLTPLVDEFDLIDRYDADHPELALIQLNDRLRVSVSDEGVLHLRFRDRDPEFAAALLRRLVDDLNAYNVNERMSRGRRTREFLELRASETTAALDTAMDSLAAYQARHAIPVTPDQIAAAQGIGELIGRKLGLQIELEALGRYMNESSPQIVQRREELSALDLEIGKLPEIGVGGARLFRDVEVLNQLFALITVQLEQARIDEKKDLALVQVLDTATAPHLRAWPKRKLIVIAAFLVSVLLGLVLIHLLDFLHRERDHLAEALQAKGG